MARILLVSTEGMIGGAESSLLSLVRNLSARFPAAVACPVPSPLSQALAAGGIESHALPQPPAVAYRSPRWAAYWPTAVGSLVKAIRRTRTDLVHANTFSAGAASLVGALITRRQLLLHARDLTDFGGLTPVYGRYAARLVAVSHTVKEHLVARGVPPTKIAVAYNGLDGGGPPGAGACAGTAVPHPMRRAGDFVFAQVGQFVPWKNHDIFLQAAGQVARDLPHAQFAFVGDDLFRRDGAYKRSLYYAARYSPAAERIHFWGWRTDMEDVWPAIDCLVHTAEHEPFGRVIIEAMAHRIPVIAAAGGGPAEILRTGQTGVLVPPRDVEALAAAMLRVARDREFAATIAAAGRRHALCYFTAAQTAARVQEIYEEVLSAQSPHENRSELP
jgi:glycosyltransferase involved in cell wall biosynthesis